MEIISYVRINGNVSKRIPLGIEVNSGAELKALKTKLESDWKKERGTKEDLQIYTIGFETRRKPTEAHLFGLNL